MSAFRLWILNSFPNMLLQAVRRMCEDSVEKLSMDSVRKPLDVILPKLIALLSCNDELVLLLHSCLFIIRIMYVLNVLQSVGINTGNICFVLGEIKSSRNNK